MVSSKLVTMVAMVLLQIKKTVTIVNFVRRDMGVSPSQKATSNPQSLCRIGDLVDWIIKLLNRDC